MPTAAETWHRVLVRIRDAGTYVCTPIDQDGYEYLFKQKSETKTDPTEMERHTTATATTNGWMVVCTIHSPHTLNGAASAQEPENNNEPKPKPSQQQRRKKSRRSNIQKKQQQASKHTENGTRTQRCRCGRRTVNQVLRECEWKLMRTHFSDGFPWKNATIAQSSFLATLPIDPLVCAERASVFRFLFPFDSGGYTRKGGARVRQREWKTERIIFRISSAHTLTSATQPPLMRLMPLKPSPEAR